MIRMVAPPSSELQPSNFGQVLARHFFKSVELRHNAAPAVHMSGIQISSVSFTDMDDEGRAHLYLVKGRLEALVHAQEYLGTALESLRITHAHICMEVEELGRYIINLPPYIDRTPEQFRDESGTRTSRPPPVTKAIVMKLRAWTNALRR
ncbi:hypothetical protein C2E23DRAFT_887220 [Lenzites betulinus]|nr:hypothetical protein C2E23DRAFT_887220 [Lenzites betulinus]